MNLYIFNESSQAAMYGIGTYINELIDGVIRDSNINLSVINLRSDKPKIQIEEIDGVQHWHFPAPIQEPQTTKYQNIIKLYYRNVVYLLRLHIEDRNNLIFHLNYNQSNKLAEELKKSFSCKIIYGLHYLDWCIRLLGNIKYFKKILTTREIDQGDFDKTICKSYWNEKELFEIVDHIICFSKNTKQILQDYYKVKSDQVTVIYNGLIDRNSVTDKQAMRQKYNIPDIPIIFFAGRLDDAKGITYTLRAFKIVLEKQPCHFIIVGNGAYDNYMKECEDIWIHVTWTGRISKDKLYDLYSVADIGVLLSFTEQCNYVAIEMMMHSISMITSSASGLAEMTEDGISSLQVPVIEHLERVEIDTDLLAEKILYLLEHPEERKRIGENARKQYLEKYSSPIFRQNMLVFYRSLFIE